MPITNAAPERATERFAEDVVVSDRVIGYRLVCRWCQSNRAHESPGVDEALAGGRPLGRCPGSGGDRQIPSRRTRGMGEALAGGESLAEEGVREVKVGTSLRLSLARETPCRNRVRTPFRVVPQSWCSCSTRFGQLVRKMMVSASIHQPSPLAGSFPCPLFLNSAPMAPRCASMTSS